MPNRRQFLSYAALGASGLFPEGLFAKQPKKNRHPNVLFIICDDLNDSIRGMSGRPQAITPNIDELGSRGVRFNNAHCNAQACGPSRASLWTGLYPHTTGYFGHDQNSNHWRKNPTLRKAETIFEYFKTRGYSIAGTGKIFHNGQEDKSAWSSTGAISGFAGNSDFGPNPWDGVSKESWGALKAFGHPSMPKELRENWTEGFGPLSDVPTIPPNPATGAPGYTGWALKSKPFRYVNEEDRDLMPDEASTLWAMSKLRSASETPFFLAVGYNRPHVPRYAPKKYFDMYPLETIELPPYLEDDLKDVPRSLYTLPDNPDLLMPRAKALPALLAAGGVDLWKRWIQSYLACVTFVDDQVGQILHALNSGPHKDNTVIVFTSDHGYHMGEKDHLSKFTIWEETTHIPLIIAAPGVSKAGAVCYKPVSLVDLYPTLCDLCGLTTDISGRPNRLPVDGYSLRPFLLNPEHGSWDGPSVALASNEGLPFKVSAAAPIDEQIFSVRDERYRYTLSYDGEEEFYDLLEDPNCWENRTGEDRYKKQKAVLRATLIQMTGRSVSGPFNASP